MNDKPRRWFQIHLSTAIVLMLLTSTLMFANFRLRTIEAHENLNQSYPKSAMILDSMHCYEQGFPFTCLHFDRYVHLNPNQTVDQDGELKFKPLLANLSTCIASLVIAASALEWRIRRREVRKP